MNSNKEIYRRAIDLWGERGQLEMAQEEATELALAVRKYIREPNMSRLDDLAGEVADVEIMVAQMKEMIPDLSHTVEEKKLFKLNRLEVRIENFSRTIASMKQ
jgi:NTP pyrophosphatase (non-canonical NTP hydrolase)